MANPRRTSYSNPTSEFNSVQQQNPQSQSISTSLISFLKRPHAFPFLLSIFLLLTWVSLRVQHLHRFSPNQEPSSDTHTNLKIDNSNDEDRTANLVRFTSVEITKDKRGWMLDPVTVAHRSGLPAGSQSCTAAHVGEIRPGGLRGNHRHHTCNETFIIWGAETRFRLENPSIDKGYAEVTIGAEEVAVASCPSGIAHAILNVDPVRTAFLLGCQDDVITYNSSSTDFNVWKDL